MQAWNFRKSAMPTGQPDGVEGLGDPLPVFKLVEAVAELETGVECTSSGAVTVVSTTGARGQNHFNAFCLFFSIDSCDFFFFLFAAHCTEP
jgi:hypothetical protein